MGQNEQRAVGQHAVSWGQKPQRRLSLSVAAAWAHLSSEVVAGWQCLADAFKWALQTTVDMRPPTAGPVV